MMLRFLFCLVSLTLIAIVYGDNSVQPVGIRVITDINKFRAANPSLKIGKLVKKTNQGQLVYTLGNRVPGDRVVSQGTSNFQYPSLQDVQLTFNYPTMSGRPAVVSHVEINVQQSSNIGDAYVVSGGIGYKEIEIVVVAKRTKYFNSKLLIHGYFR